MSTNGASNPATDKASAEQSSSGGEGLSKDQVGWYFVEQYYNTVSKNPEKLHLFYGKKSQFVYGAEAEVAKISVGRQAIQERIKLLDFQDCKVRISNVDTQSSYDNIVIQVIGEFSNKGGEPKKFVQTFILAQQPSGYFVLNDILRCIDDEDAEEETAEAQGEEPAPAEPAPETEETAAPAELNKAEETVAEPAPSGAFDAGVVDKKLEQVTESAEADDGAAAESAPEVPEVPDETTEEAPEKATPATEAPDPDATARQIAEEDTRESERPKEPSPTPVGPKAPPPEPEKPAAPVPAPAPAKPMTWASRVAASAGAPRPVVPLKAATPPAPAQARPPAVAPPSQPAQPAQPGAAGAATPTEEPATARKDANEWQTAGESSKRQSRPQSMVGPSGEKEATSCYVKYVSDKVRPDDLRAALSIHGELTYFDINRSKNCAFVDFATVQGYQAAIAASPYNVNGESITVEARRKPGGYGGSGYGPGRGSMSGRGRGGFDGGRSGSQRGNFGPQGGRGRGSARGPRGAAQVSTS